MEDEQFFNEVDSMGIVELHIQQVLKMEDSKATALLRRYKEIRSELRDRLDRAHESTFTAQQLRGVLTQVDAAIIAMNISLKTGMKEAALPAALMGVEHQLSELAKFQDHFQGAVVPININAQLVAQDTANFLINQYDSSLDAYSESVRSGLVGALTQEMLLESPLSKVVKSMGQYFQGEEWKLQRIARTELHSIYNIAKLGGMEEVKEQVLPDLMKTLIHPMDMRTGQDSKFAASLELIVPLDKPFKYRWKGKTRVFVTPPDRPNDRAILVPYRREWTK